VTIMRHDGSRKASPIGVRVRFPGETGGAPEPAPLHAEEE